MKAPAQRSERHPPDKETQLAIGIAIGAGVRVALGTAMVNISLGIAIGVALGATFWVLVQGKSLMAAVTRDGR